MNTHNTPETQADSQAEWRSCAPGDLGQFVTVMKKRKKIGHLITGAEILTACLAIGLVGFFGMQQLPGSPEEPGQSLVAKGKKCPGGLYCDEVLEQAQAFVAHKLDQETSDKMKEHLAACPHCQKKVDQLRANMHNNAAAHKALPQKEAEWEAFLLTLNQ